MFEILWKTSCTHDKITPNMAFGYCPDCGEYVQNRWYLFRCKCCGIKQKIRVRKGKMITETNFCRNCGSSSFVEEELESLDIVNVNYAVFKRTTTKAKIPSQIQTWIEETSYTSIKLLPCY